MTALGKMMLFLVLVLSIVWTWLTLNAYVTRNNWRSEAAFYEAEAKKAAASANEMKKLNDALRDAHRSESLADKAAIAQQAKQIQAFDDLIRGFKDSFAGITKVTTKISADGKIYQTNIDQYQNQVANQNGQLNAKDAELDVKNRELSAQTQKAEFAQLDANAQKQRADELLEKFQKLQDQMEELRTGGGRIPLPGQPRVAPLARNFKGTVQSVDNQGGDVLVVVSPGLDAGLQKGSTLSISRTNPPLYLGKVVVILANPKSATGRFVPAAGVRQVPQFGDEVKPD